MSASPEFYNPAAPVFSPCGSPLLLHGAAAGAGAGAGEGAAAAVWEEERWCRTPTGGESQVTAPGTCPPAPRKPRAPAAPAPCRKRLFEMEVFSLRLEELERLFWRPNAAPPAQKKRRRVACPEPKKTS